MLILNKMLKKMQWLLLISLNGVSNVLLKVNSILIFISVLIGIKLHNLLRLQFWMFNLSFMFISRMRLLISLVLLLLLMIMPTRVKQRLLILQMLMFRVVILLLQLMLLWVCLICHCVNFVNHLCVILLLVVFFKLFYLIIHCLICRLVVVSLLMNLV